MRRPEDELANGDAAGGREVHLVGPLNLSASQLEHAVDLDTRLRLRRQVGKSALGHGIPKQLEAPTRSHCRRFKTHALPDECAGAIERLQRLCVAYGIARPVCTSVHTVGKHPNDEGRLSAALEVSVGRFAGLFAALRLVGRDSGGGIRTRDLRVMRGFKKVRKRVICRAFVILHDVTRGQI